MQTQLHEIKLPNCHAKTILSCLQMTILAIENERNVDVYPFVSAFVLVLELFGMAAMPFPCNLPGCFLLLAYALMAL